MDIKLLRAMVTLAELGNYRLAGDSLYISQPALTKQIQLLELRLGLPVFVRGRHGAELTAAGQRLYTKAKDLLSQYDAFMLHAEHVATGNTGELSLGFGISFFELAPNIVRKFREKFPEVNIRLDDLPTEEQCMGISSGKLDAGFVRLPVKPPLDAVALLTEKLVLAIPAALTRYRIPEEVNDIIEQLPLLQISPMRGKGLSAQIALFLSSQKIIPGSIQYAADIHTLLALVAAGNGCALLPQGALNITPPEVRLITLDGPHACWQVGIAWNGDTVDLLRDNFVKIASSMSKH
ncbi:hypothetical protein Z042_14860 [Chania multitudinisentens RB-25]|uniref:HTH lysR-type domain-containing protein n=1 Tax=Chania multitudinisentens RB-25 TaxID=1441930 RepID=W0LED1_9GAMM|nr:LysR family transcriptional regulator [Chania multitudinisentens]AHG20739.1 hypothetical protein Z042_14860 [Chania multitudinisentens RB-25]